MKGVSRHADKQRMCFDVNNPYFRQKVMTASPEELRLLLIEGCIRFLKQGREAQGVRNYEKIYDNFTNARNILIELMSSLKHELAPELCANLDAIYTYVFKRITEGSFEKSTTKIDEAIALMEYDRETWLLLMEKLAEERAGTAPAGAAAALAGERADASGYQSFSVQG